MLLKKSLKPIRNWITLTAIILFVGLQSTHAEENLTLNEVLTQLYGADQLNPSNDSLLGKYIKEANAQTVVRQFWRAPLGSVNPPHEYGPKRLIVAVSPQTFPIFKKYFSSEHFLYLLNEHGNFAAFEGKMSNPRDPWHGQVLDTEFTYRAESKMAIPMILDSAEGARARLFFKLSSLNRDLARFPWKLESSGVLGVGGKPYSGHGAWATGCGTWIGNMPIGSELVDEYYFPSGDADGTQPNSPALRKYKTPRDLDEETEKVLRQVWTVPGHQQLGEVLDPGANRRGEFDNAGWASFTFFGSASAERVPVIFLFVKDASTPIDPEFKFIIDSYGPY